MHEIFGMTMYFNRSKCEQGGGTGVVFFMPQGVPIPYSFKLAFPCTNNNVEYEALILGLKEAITLKFERLMIYSDSLLVVNQVLGVYQCHNELLKSYREEIVRLLKFFKSYKIESSPISYNHFMDTMAYLGSLIPPKPHQHIQHVEILTLKESYVNSSLPFPLIEASIDEISVES